MGRGSVPAWGLPAALLAALAAGCGDDGTPASDAGPGPDAVIPGDAGSDAAGDARADAGAPMPDAGLVRREGLTEADGPVQNPDRGLYAWDWDDSVDLVLVKPYLGDWCDGSTLPAAFLDGLRDRLGGHRDAGRKVILRFVYADDGALNSCGLADAESVDLIEAHVRQLAPLLAEHEDVISYVEAGLLGMWGEWNSEYAPAGTSLAADAGNRRRVLAALLDAVPASRPILVRRPRFRQEVEADLTAEQLARVGFHNDCFLASDTDAGTYDGARSIDEWKDYIHDAALTVPMGGETCRDTLPYTSCDNALAEMERLRFGYLHVSYRPEVIARFRDEGCFDEIERRLGYRMVLRAVESPPAVDAGGPLPVVAELENVGWAPPYTTRRPRLVLRSGDSGAVVLETRASGDADSRSWHPGTTARLELEADVPADLTPGEWEIRLLLLDDASDAPAYALLVANTAPERDDVHREAVLSSVTVR